MKTDETNPRHWLEAGRARLTSADHLHFAEGASAAVVELLQEAVERYLKGYLIDRGWSLQRIHDLTVLLDAAAGYDARFRAFLDMSEALTDQFWAQHYPGGDLTDVGSDYEELRKSVGEMAELIEKEIASDRS